jgi:hypothetical protein
MWSRPPARGWPQCGQARAVPRPGRLRLIDISSPPCRWSASNGTELVIPAAGPGRHEDPYPGKRAYGSARPVCRGPSMRRYPSHWHTVDTKPFPLDRPAQS